MYWSYEYISQKFLPEIKDVWSVKEIIEQTASLGDDTYLIYAPTGQEYSYKDTNLAANRIANELSSLGLRKGDRIGIYMSNTPEYIFTLFAAAKLGLIEVPINTNFQENEIQYMINKADIKTIVVESNKGFFNILDKVVTHTPSLESILISGEMSNVPESFPSVHSLAEMLMNGDDCNPNVSIDGSDEFSVLFTSGTTGLPKGAITRNKTAVLGAMSFGVMPVSRKSRNYTCLPLFHINAQTYSTLAIRCLGGSLVLGQKFSASKFWDDIIKYNADSFNCLGGMMQILDSVYKQEEVPKHPAKMVFVGGTPINLWERFEEKFKVDIYEGFAMTEAPVLFNNCYPDKNERKIGSVGKPLFWDLGRGVRLVDDQNRVLEVGTGELQQKGEDFITKGYWAAPEAEKEAFTEDGWFRTGDILRVDEEGYYYYVDRNKFMIRVGGENVSAFEVEDVVNSHPAVAQSAAIPVDDPYKGEEIKVLIRLKDNAKGVDFKEIVALCAKKLAYFKVPRYIEIVEEFPKTPTERIQKVQLKEAERKRTMHGWDRNIELPNWRNIGSQSTSSVTF